MLSDVELRAKIRGKVVELAARLGQKAANVSDDAILLELGLLDSASVLELLVWLESQFNIEFGDDELSLDNFGSISRMAELIGTRQAG